MADMAHLGKAFVFLNVADQGTTAYGLARGGVEGNPVFNYLFRTIGFGCASVVKMFLAVALVFLLTELMRRQPGLAWVARNALLVLCAVYAVVVTWNVLGA